MLMNFELLKLKFHLEALDTLYFPHYLGSTLRGGLGHALKKETCVNPHRECVNCTLTGDCPYSYCFETPADKSSHTKNTYLPHPYVLEPPILKRNELEKGEKFSFNLLLIGRGIRYLPYFVLAIDSLGRKGLGRDRGRFKLLRVTSTDGVEVFAGNLCMPFQEPRPIRFSDILLESAGVKSDWLRIDFITWARIKPRSRPTDRLDFAMFMQHLLGRISLLSHYHCSEDFLWEGCFPSFDGVKTVSSELSWYDWERYSTRKKRPMKLGGVLGNITFAGNFAPFLPYIILGKYIHIGKQTSFGLGKYRITMKEGTDVESPCENNRHRKEHRGGPLILDT